MALPYTDYIKHCYILHRHYGGRNPDFIADSLTIGNTENTFCNRLSLKIDISKDTVEIPSYGAEDTFGEAIVNIEHPESISTIYYPIINNVKGTLYRRNAPKDEYKSASPAIKAFFVDTYTREGVRKIKVGAKEYYGGRGLILTADMKPLLLTTLEFKKELLVYNDTLNSVKYKPVRPIIRVHPDVYKSDDPIEKHIRTKLLPEAIMLDNPNLYSDCKLTDRYNSMAVDECLGNSK